MTTSARITSTNAARASKSIASFPACKTSDLPSKSLLSQQSPNVCATIQPPRPALDS